MIKRTKQNTNVINFNEHLEKKGLIAPKPFEELASKLENKISKIELELKDSIKLLEKDILELTKQNQSYASSQEFKKEFEEFSLVLETRIQNSLAKLKQEAPNKLSKNEGKLVKKLITDLSKILSFDFYKNITNQMNIKTQKAEVDDFGMDQEAVKMVKPFFDFLYYKYWRVNTTGISNIPNQGQALLVGNHSGALPYDGSMMAAAVVNEHPVRRDARFLVEDFVYHMPMLGSFMYRIGAIRACPENAERLLNNDHLVIVFPEGVKGIGKYFNQRYKLQRFGRGGFIKLCMKTKSPLIPVGIVGAEEIHPIIYKSNILAKSIGVPYIPITPTFPFLGLLGMIPLPTKWHIHFGKPISFDKYAQKAIKDELLVHKLSEQVRGNIQSILLELLKNRRSVWTD